MKVRHKRIACAGYEVMEEAPSYYLAKSGDGVLALAKDDWEPVPTDTWRDVTAEVSFQVDTGGFNIVYQLYHNKQPVDFGSNYRLRKVQLHRAVYPFPHDQLGQQPLRYDLVDAFIIEKKEENREG